MQLASKRPPDSATYHVDISKDICVKVTKSKMQLIILICKCLQEWREKLHKMEESLW